MARYEVRELTADMVDEAARLLAERHRHQRRTAFALDRKYEDLSATRELIAALVGREAASGAISLVHGCATAFVLGTHRPDSIWGPNVWIEDAGSGGTDAEGVREAYTAAAGRWVESGRTSHFVVVPASDTNEMEAGFSLGFGRQQVHAIREPVWREFVPTLAPA